MTITIVGGSNPSSPTFPVQRSVRLRSSASAYFTRTFGVPISQNTWTYSVWVKRGALTGFQNIGPSPSGQNTQFYFDSSTNALGWVVNGGNCFLTTQVFRDPSAWYHIVLAFNGGAASNKVRLYVNGVEVTAFSTDNRSTTTTTSINTVVAHSIGNYLASVTNYFDGYLTEINFVDGQQLTANSFGAYNSYGVWSPSKYTGTYGNNGFYLNFQDNSAATAAAIGKDSSGNGNNWTPNNISVTAGVTYDSMLDVPTNTNASNANFATFNPLKNTASISSGNLQSTNTGASGYYTSYSTMEMTSGKYYWELTATDDGVNARYAGFGIADPTIALTSIGTTLANTPANNSRGWMQTVRSSISVYGTALFNSGASVNTTTRATTTGTRIFMVAYDADTGKCWMGYEGTWWTGDPAAGTSQYFTASAPMMPVLVPYNDGSNSNSVYAINCGQRPFSYTPPTGFKSLNTFNLPTPTIPNGAAQFAATLYTGNGTTVTAINTVNGVSFQPDLVWVKSRNAVISNGLFDSNRGLSKGLFSDVTQAEFNYGTGPTAEVYLLNSNGFSVGSFGNFNANTTTYVGWQWKANGTPAVINTAGSVPSTISVNTTSGFSIVTYTGTSANATVGHGLGVTPAMIIVKCRINGTPNWRVWHKALGTTDSYLGLNQTAGVAASTSVFNSQSSTTFGIGTDPATNSSSAMVAYCFSEIAGYSKFGSYTGNNSTTDGPFVYLGFRPRFLIIKSTTAGTSWVMMDSSRNTYNLADTSLYADSTNSESTIGTVNDIDFLSNGFKLRNNTGFVNASQTYIYAAFAENPFNYSLAR